MVTHLRRGEYFFSFPNIGFGESFPYYGVLGRVSLFWNPLTDILSFIKSKLFPTGKLFPVESDGTFQFENLSWAFNVSFL